MCTVQPYYAFTSAKYEVQPCIDYISCWYLIELHIYAYCIVYTCTYVYNLYLYNVYRAVETEVADLEKLIHASREATKARASNQTTAPAADNVV